MRSTVSSGVHQGLDLREGRERGVSSSRRAVRDFSEDENHTSSWAKDGCEGTGDVQKDWRRGRNFSQLVRSQQETLGIGLSVGGTRVISMGTWSEHVEGRDVVSEATKAGNISGLEKDRSIALEG